MLPRIGPVPVYAILYFAGILVHGLLARRLAGRPGLSRRTAAVVSRCYFLSKDDRQMAPGS